MPFEGQGHLEPKLATLPFSSDIRFCAGSDLWVSPGQVKGNGEPTLLLALLVPFAQLGWERTCP